MKIKDLELNYNLMNVNDLEPGVYDLKILKIEDDERFPPPCISVCFGFLQKEYMGCYLYYRFRVLSNSDAQKDYYKRMLAELINCVGINDITDTSELHGEIVKAELHKNKVGKIDVRRFLKYEKSADEKVSIADSKKTNSKYDDDYIAGW